MLRPSVYAVVFTIGLLAMAVGAWEMRTAMMHGQSSVLPTIAVGLGMATILLAKLTLNADPEARTLKVKLSLVPATIVITFQGVLMLLDGLWSLVILKPVPTPYMSVVLIVIGMGLILYARVYHARVERAKRSL
jgi:hypothetical protein